MLRTRHLLVGLLLSGLLFLTVPVVALAGGGGSAGDNQYVDPLNTQTSQTSTNPGGSSGSSSSGSSSSPGSSSTLSSAPATVPSSATPVATTAAGTSSAGKQLPYTGYDNRTAAGFGLLLLAGGYGLRRRTRRA